MFRIGNSVGFKCGLCLVGGVTSSFAGEHRTAFTSTFPKTPRVHHLLSSSQLSLPRYHHPLTAPRYLLPQHKPPKQHIQFNSSKYLFFYTPHRHCLSCSPPQPPYCCLHTKQARTAYRCRVRCAHARISELRADISVHASQGLSHKDLVLDFKT